MLVMRENDPPTGCWNATLLTLLGLLVIAAAIGIGVGIFAPNKPKEEAVVVEMAHPITGETSSECLVLLPPEVSEEPRYRIGRDGECAGE